MVDVSDRVKPKWNGKWIWVDYAIPKNVVKREHEKNKYCLVRRKFRIEKNIDNAVLNITADSRYKLFINGKYVGRGISRCEAYYWYYNSYDVTDFLNKGENVIAISCRFYGEDFAYYTSPGGIGHRKDNAGRGGLLFDFELNMDDDSVLCLGSDQETKIILNKGEASKLPLKNGCLGFIEQFDSRKVPKNWNEVDFDDSSWKKPVVLNYPIKTILFDENHPLHEEFVYPSEILVVGENDDIRYEEDFDEEDEAEMDFCIEHMLEGPIDELKSFEIINREALLGGDGICEIVPKEGSRGKVLSIYVKFDKEMVGYPQVTVDGPEGIMVDFIPSEKMVNNLPALDFMGNKRGSRVILRGGKQFFEQWDWEGYLYMLVKVRDLTGPMKVIKLGSNRTHMRITKEGYFKCSDPKLDELWKACGHTVLCCAIDGYLDCPSREQRAYLGDAYPEALIANACFGEPRLTKKLIYDTAFGQRQDGMTYSFHPGDAVPECHIIPDYNLYWMQLTRDYHLYYGDDKVLEDMYPHFLLSLQWFWKYIDKETGLLTDLPYWTFIDWSFAHDKPGKWAILNTQFMDVLLFIADLAKKFGDASNEKKFQEKAKQLLGKIDEVFWDEKEGCYRDYYHEGKLHQLSYMTNSYLVLKGITTDKKKIDSIVARIFEYPGSEEMIKKQIDDFYLRAQSHHAFGNELKDMVIVAQPFFQHNVHKFFSLIGRYDLLLKYIYKWVPMLELGKTKTIWETWSIDASECHAWAATPAYDLSTYWMGVKPVVDKPGFQAVEISPTFHGLESVEGMFPTCKGDIFVKWKKEGNSVDVEIILPDMINEGVFKVPTLDGKENSNISTSNGPITELNNAFALNPGENHFKIDY
ncbi:MAG: alpha-L-rhamnosidase N-terminal domain-containing protein [Candidatus Hodarchaeota archaeon]